MKKSIIFLGLAVTLFSNVAMASVPAASSTVSVKKEYTNATPLAIAIAKGDVTSVKAFISYGADIMRNLTT